MQIHDTASASPFECVGTAFSPEDRELTSASLIARIRTHSDPNDGFSSIYPSAEAVDYDTHPFLAPEVYAVRGTPLTLDLVKAANQADFNAIIDHFVGRPKLLETIGKQFEAGKSGVVVTDHVNVTDGIKGALGLFAALQHKEIIQPDDIDIILFANAMIKFTQSDKNGLTAEYLRLLFSKTYYTHPEAVGANSQFSIPEAVHNAVNRAVLRDYLNQKKQNKPTLTVIAGGGGRDKRVGDIIHTRPMSDTTARLLVGQWAIGLGCTINDGTPSIFTTAMREHFYKDAVPAQGQELLRIIGRSMAALTGVTRQHHETIESFNAATEPQAA